MSMLFKTILTFLHHRIGDLESRQSVTGNQLKLHHRIGDLEIWRVYFVHQASLHHRIGDLENLSPKSSPQ